MGTGLREALARRSRKQGGGSIEDGADPVSRRTVDAAIQGRAGAGLHATRLSASCVYRLLSRRGAAAPMGGAEKVAPLMLPSSPSLRSMDRSFLLRAPLPCRLPSLSASGVASRDERGFD